MVDIKKIDVSKKTSKKTKRRTPFRDFIWYLIMIPVILIAFGFNAYGMVSSFSGAEYIFIPLISIGIVYGLAIALTVVLKPEFED